jgi:hypothetical protein
MSGIFHRDMLVDTKAVDVENRRVPVIASSEAVDGHGEIVKQDWDLGRFLRNPVVLWNHNKLFQADTLPIGRAENVRVANEGTQQATLLADLVMASEEANPQAQRVLLLFAEGIQRAVSVGFRPRKIRREEIDGEDVVTLSDNLLLEISATPIGSNPDALAEQRALEAEYIARHLSDARAVVPYAGYPVITGQWDGRAADRRLRAWAGGESLDWAKYRRGFGWFDSANPEAFDSYKLPHHDIMDGDIKTHRGGVIAAGNAIQGGRGGVDIPDGERAGVRSHLARHYRQFDMQPPWERSAEATHCEQCFADTELTQAARDTSPEWPGPAVLCAECWRKEEPKELPSPQRGDETTNTREGEVEMADNEKAQAALDEAKAKCAVLEAKNAELEAKISEATGTIEDATERLETFEKQNKRLQEERDAAVKKADEAQAKLDEAAVDGLIGKKLAPAEKEWALKLKRSNPQLFSEMLEQRSDMNLLNVDGSSRRLLDDEQTVVSDDNASKAAADAVEQAAYGG